MKFTLAISKERMPFASNRLLQVITVSFAAIWISTLTGTTDLNNWMLENTLTILFLIFLVTTFRTYQFSDLSYLLIFVYLSLHVYGSKYTYAENPFGYWIKDLFDAQRNHYDRIVHFCFGFLLAYPMRELFLKWLKYPIIVAWVLPVEVTLSISGFYELIEWAVADVFFQAQGQAYLGTQGDVWDAQKDIFLAFSGAILATTVVSSIKKIFGIHNDANK
ncbi:MAG: Inner membrane protein YjdF [Saprospiraceae bacterium]|jgi:putative membrane protein|nr:Inner membrane protein YjdF [Saprospiraceae bacterium]